MKKIGILTGGADCPGLNAVIRALVLRAILLPVFVSSCASNEPYEDRMDRRTDAYVGSQDRREIRQDARQERTDAWYDRVMH